MADNLQRLFVPREDGGVFAPAIEYASLLFTNYSGSLLGGAGNDTGPAVGNMLVNWFLQNRLASQTVQLVGAGVWLLVTLLVLIIVFIVTMTWRPEVKKCSCRLWRSARRRWTAYATDPRPSRRSPSQASLMSRVSSIFPKRLRECHLAMRLAVFVAILVVCAATLGVYWQYSGYGFGHMFQTQSQGGGSGGLSGAVNSAVDTLNDFIEDTLVRTNSSVVATCNEALPGILDMFNRMAKGYLDLLSADFKLTPLMDTFDNFLALVKRLLASMNWIKDSRDSVLSPLNSFTTVVNRTRDDIRSQVTDVCAASPGNGVPVELCAGINQHLNQLTIGLDSRRIDSDSSVTIVTLLDKIFKLNVSEVEAQVNSAKSLLTGSLSLIGDEITTLFNSLVGELSGLFAGALSGADGLRSAMQNATQSDSFQGVFRTADGVMQAVTAVIVLGFCLMLLPVAVMLGFQVYFYYHWGALEAATGERQMGGDGPPADFCDSQGPPQDWQQRQQPPQLRTFTSIVEANHEDRQQATQRQGVKVHRHTEKVEASKGCICTGPFVTCMFIVGVLFALLFFLFGFALLYAGSEIQMDVCRYMTTQGGTAVVDGMLDTLMDHDLWPLVETALATKISIPLPLTKSMLPKGLLKILLRDCANSSATIFQILGIANAFNVSELLKAKEIQTQLYKGKDMVDGLVGGLNASTLIPPEVDSILAVLPDFAKIIDTQDFSASIAELDKPLLILGNQVPQLIGELLAVVRILTDRNPSDSRAVLIRHFAENLNVTYQVDYPALSSKLAQMRQQFVTLQTNRLVQNLTYELTVNLAQLKLGLSNKTVLLNSVAVRYDQVLTAYMPEMAQLLNQLLAIILTRVGQCDGVATTLGILVSECNSSLATLPYGGFYVATSSALLVLLCALAMPLMRAVRRHKRQASNQLRQSTEDIGQSQDWQTQDFQPQQPPPPPQHQQRPLELASSSSGSSSIYGGASASGGNPYGTQRSLIENTV